MTRPNKLSTHHSVEQDTATLWAHFQDVMTPEDLANYQLSNEALGAQRTREIINQLNEKAASDPGNHPDLMIRRITAQYRANTPGTAKPVESLDQILSRYKLTLQRIRAVNLAPYDEIALLKAATFAGLSRDTDKGLELATRAMRILHHEATNYYNIGKPNDSSLKITARSIYAIKALDELYDAEEAEAIVIDSADEALKKWGKFTHETASEEAEFVSEPVEIFEGESQYVGFRRLLNAEAKTRLDGLRVVGEELQRTLDPGAQVRYFEPILFNNRTDIQVAETDVSGKRSVNPSERHSESPYLTGDYVVAEVVYESNGKIITDVIAESPNYGNACYVLRGDIVDVLAETLGVRLNWRQILGYPKVTARQLGARDFRHGSQANIPRRVTGYLQENIQFSLRDIAHKWFRSEKSLYDDTGEPSATNRLPLGVKQALSHRIDVIKDRMLSWLNEVRPAEDIIEKGIGASALKDANHPDVAEASQLSESVVEALQRRNVELAMENEQLRFENARLLARFGVAKRALDGLTD